MYCWGNDGNDAGKRKELAEMGVDAIIADSFQSCVCCHTPSLRKAVWPFSLWIRLLSSFRS